jgi:hypothetical protein
LSIFWRCTWRARVTPVVDACSRRVAFSRAYDGFILRNARFGCVQEDSEGQYDWIQLVRERVTTVNASAAGGNTQLIVLSEDAV